MRKSHVGGIAIALAIGWSTKARALDTEVTSDTSAQFYDVRSPTGETVLARRRIVTTLGANAYDLIDHAAAQGGQARQGGPELLFRARLRYEAETGGSGAESDVTNYGRLVPAFSRGPIDLMYGYVEGRRFFNGWLGFKLGRQYVIDALGWYAFDGADARITTPYYVAIEAYGGLEVRGGMPLSTPRFERDGVWRGDRTGYNLDLYPAFQPSDVAPAFGAAIESVGVTWLHGRLTYRRVLNTGPANVTEFASGTNAPASYHGARISQEQLGYSIDATLGDLAGARGGFAYDLYNARFSSIYASLDAFVHKRVSVSLDYDYFHPSFDGDSIWNFFISEPMNDIGLRTTINATDRLTLSAGAHTRIYTVQTQEDAPNASPQIQPSNPSYFPSSALASDGGGSLSARYKWQEGWIGARASGNFGDAGDRVGGDVYAERLLETRYIVEGRASLWQWDDKLRPDRDATSFAYVAGLGYKFAPRAQALFEWEHDMNRLVGHRFRAMLWLNVAVTR